MPQFLKDRATISTGRLRQESRTHEHRVGSDAALMFPVGVKLFWPSIIQLFHRSRRRSLNGLFRETPSGWRILVKPPGITAMSVFVWCTARFTESTRWAWKESQTRRLFFLNRPPGRDRHTFSTHSFIPVSSIHPFGWQCTRTPGRKFSFGKVFRLKITMGFSLVPSAMHASTTVNRELCWATQFSHLSHSQFGLMACQTRQAFRLCSQCEQVRNFLPSTLDYEAVEACDLLVKMFWKRLSDLRLLSKSKILSSKELGTPAVGSQEPGCLQFRSRCHFASRAPTFRWHRIHGLRRNCLTPLQTWRLAT